MQREERKGADSSQQGVGLYEIEEVAGPRWRAPRWEPRERSRRRPPPTAAPEGRSHRRWPGPTTRPASVVAAMTQLEGHPAKDQRRQDEKQRQVKTTEDRGVPERERGERGATRGEKPDFVAVPDGSDGVDHHAPIEVVAGRRRASSADAEVKTLEEEVPQPEYGDQREPQLLRATGGSRQRGRARELLLVDQFGNALGPSAAFRVAGGTLASRIMRPISTTARNV